MADLPTGPKKPRSTVLTVEQESVIIAFRKHTLLPLDDCLYALQATIPALTRSSLHRCLERHGISRLPEMEGGSKPGRKKFERYPIGYFHIDLAEPSRKPRCSDTTTTITSSFAHTSQTSLPLTTSPNGSRHSAV